MSLLSNWLESLGYEVEISGECLRNISPFSTCTLCRDACQDQAIQIEKGRTAIRSDSCSACGACIPVCPAQAIKGQSPARKVIQKNLIVEEGSPLPTMPELLYFHKKGLRFMQSKPALPALDAILQEANEVLGKMGQEPYSSVQEVITEVEEAPRMTRRDFFGKLTADGKKTVLSSLTPAKWRFNEDIFRLPKLYPEWSFFEAIINKDDCTLCEACFAICPANVFTVQDGVVAIDDQKCTGCRLCQDICQSKSIRIEKNLRKAEIASHSANTAVCSKCGNTFHSWSESAECHICTSQANTDFFF